MTNPRRSRLFAQWVVKNELQYKFALYIFIVLGAAVLSLWFVANAGILYMSNMGFIRDGYVITQMQDLVRMVSVVGLAMVSLIFGVSLMLSNLVAGPIYRFETIMKKIGTGDISMTVKIRKNDELQDTASIFNEALAGLRERLQHERGRLEEGLRQAEALISELRSDGQNDAANSLEKVIAELKQQPSDIKIEADPL
jgi:methyl-accepting chemotaxis protein